MINQFNVVNDPSVALLALLCCLVVNFMFLNTYFWVNIHQILELCCVCRKSLAAAALLCSVVQDRDVDIIVKYVLLCGRGAC